MMNEMFVRALTEVRMRYAHLLSFGILLLVLTNFAALNALANNLYCPAAKAIYTSQADTTGFVAPFPRRGSAIINYNPDYLREFDCDELCIEYLVSGHECGHAYGIGGADKQTESLADCFGRKILEQRGRWSKAMEKSVGRLYKNLVQDATHKSGSQRFAEMMGVECSRKEMKIQLNHFGEKPDQFED